MFLKKCSWLWSPVVCYNILWRYINASEKPHSEEPYTLYSWILYFMLFILLRIVQVLSPSVMACILSCFSNSRTYWDQAYLSLQLLTLQKQNKHTSSPPKHTPQTENTQQCQQHPQSLKWILFGFGLSRLAQQFMVVCCMTGIRT